MVDYRWVPSGASLCALAAQVRQGLIWDAHKTYFVHQVRLHGESIKCQIKRLLKSIYITFALEVQQTNLFTEQCITIGNT